MNLITDKKKNKGKNGFPVALIYIVIVALCYYSTIYI